MWGVAAGNLGRMDVVESVIYKAGPLITVLVVPRLSHHMMSASHGLSSVKNQREKNTCLVL